MERFFASLMMIYCHDIIAADAANELNVTWDRTAPIIVSVVDEPQHTYITLKCDHNMGMTVIGTINNMWTFKYVCSSLIPFIESIVMNNITLSMYEGEQIWNSAPEHILNAFENGSNIEMFTQDVYVIMKLMDQDDVLLVLDPETGIMRDVVFFEVYRNENYNGAYCFHDPLTGLAVDFAGEVIGNNLVYYEWLHESNDDYVVVNAAEVNTTTNGTKVYVSNQHSYSNPNDAPSNQWKLGKKQNWKYIAAHICLILTPAALLSPMGGIAGAAANAIGWSSSIVLNFVIDGLFEPAWI